MTLLARTSIPRLYPILVPSRVGKGTLPEILDFATELAQGGATLIQLREKHASSREILRLARELRRVLPESVQLILNDRADLCVASGVNGVHVGQDDLPPEAARRIVGSERIVGLSTHNPEQIKAGDESAADYVAVGPVFSTSSKENPDPVIGLEGVKRARGLTKKPLVAIGGITFEDCRAVIDAGADSVAVITDLLPDPRKRTTAFLLKLR